MWCVADIKVRTNNALEGWHHRFNGLLGRHRTYQWALITMLQEEQAASDIILQQILAGHVINRKQVAYGECDRRINCLRERYQRGSITAVDYISGVAHNLATF